MGQVYNFQELLAQAQTAKYDVLPDGDYDVVVEEASNTPTSSGKDMIKVKMKVVTGPHQGRYIFNQHVLSPENPNALSFFFRHMNSFGLDRGWIATLGAGTLDPLAQALVGRQATVSLATRDWNGEARNDVKNIKPSAGGGVSSAVPGGLPQPGVPGLPVPGPTPAPAAPAPAGWPPGFPQPAAAAPAPTPTPPPPPPVPPQQPMPQQQPMAPPPAAPPAPPGPPPAPAPTPAPAPVPPPPPVQVPAQPEPAQPPVTPIAPQPVPASTVPTGSAESAAPPAAPQPPAPQAPPGWKWENGQWVQDVQQPPAQVQPPVAAPTPGTAPALPF